MDLLAVEELEENVVIISFGDAIGADAGGFDECFQRTVKQLVNLTVVVIIVADSCLELMGLCYE